MDVSTVHTLTRLWRHPSDWQGRADAPHRASPDLAEPIRILCHYQRAVWTPA